MVLTSGSVVHKIPLTIGTAILRTYFFQNYFKNQSLNFNESKIISEIWLILKMQTTPFIQVLLNFITLSSDHKFSDPGISQYCTEIPGNFLSWGKSGLSGLYPSNQRLLQQWFMRKRCSFDAVIVVLLFLQNIWWLGKDPVCYSCNFFRCFVTRSHVWNTYWQQ